MKGIIGIGNPLKSDDGIGVALLREMEKREFPQQVQTFEVGIASMDLLHILEDLDKAILIDAVHFGGAPGDYCFFTPDNVDSLQESSSPHTADILDVLELSREMGGLPEEIIIMGIEPDDTSFGEGFSKNLEENFPELKKTLYEKIGVFFEF
ncbi:hypothetical protein AKJ52_02440 [candidate division MSBL1 archaeon SCGC-AAA382C18]|uniref:Hydrogenase maturation protease n=1 Tax=candidate division MSBL1 archaeon SCGC-AAA382C18 TaxID=1698281 RepID=A0A133VID1_9EURY|nr:hypothetical protein AKJ52_02440 [candidate division MSBL1 archaeon SCGC-AAA382C18]